MGLDDICFDFTDTVAEALAQLEWHCNQYKQRRDYFRSELDALTKLCQGVRHSPSAHLGKLFELACLLHGELEEGEEWSDREEEILRRVKCILRRKRTAPKSHEKYTLTEEQGQNDIDH